MSRGRGKGGKQRKKAKNLQVSEKRELAFKEEGQEYGQVLRMLGNGRLEAHCFDGVKRMCTIRGKLKNRVWINTGDIVLIGLREFGDEKADVISKFYDDEAKELKELGEIPEHVKINEGDFDIDEDDHEDYKEEELELNIDMI